ncbi:MAG: glycerol-3-phosphate acyltransferase [Acidimicrobiaceae bacterium]|jgi:glycerol-3-phosphate acyltransferase PlsY|nr:glycerol-3-phosphate acyltransferase [Ilumatobacteraceae bacterium]
MNVINLILGIVGGYLLGTLPSAIIVARAKGVDITTFGSGNPGASNVARAIGWRYGSIVFVLDAAKGAIPALLLIGHRPSAYICGAVAIVGHIFPATRGFKGGKGIATGAGVLLVLHPLIMIISAVSWIAIMKLSKKASVASIVVVPLVVVLLIVTGKPAWEIFAFIGIGLLIEVRHLSNIKRLLSGSEPPVSGTRG